MAHQKMYELVQSTTEPPWLLDLSLWYAWHSKQQSMPLKWAGLTQVEICRTLGTPSWMPYKPWKASYAGIDIQTEQGEDEKVIHYKVGTCTLTASWTLGPDGDWWQMEHLIGSPDDFEPALELADALVYHVDPEPISAALEGQEKIILAVELPRRPLSDLLHDFLGWGAGLLMLVDYEEEVDRLLAILDGKLQTLVERLSSHPGSILLSPDNLDGQYISPDLFERYLKQSYRRTSQTAEEAGKPLVIHVGGPMKHLLGGLSETGVDVVEGVSGPPQSDVPLPDARQIAGPDLTLWGGIPQDWLLETTPVEDFRAGIERVIGEGISDGNAILGVADRVPAAAEIDRLEMLQDLIGNA
jgi:hypothetical protein